jgi:hypothetical protein
MEPGEPELTGEISNADCGTQAHPAAAHIIP